MLIDERDCFYFKDKEYIKTFTTLEKEFFTKCDKVHMEDIEGINDILYEELKDIGYTVCKMDNKNLSYCETEHTICVKVNRLWYRVDYSYDITIETDGVYIDNKGHYIAKKFYFIKELDFYIKKCSKKDIEIVNKYDITLYANDKDIEKIKQILKETIGNDKMISINRQI